MASLLRRRNKFYVRVYANGRAKDISTGTSSPRLARKFLQKVEYENATGPVALATRTPMPELLARLVAYLNASTGTSSGARPLPATHELRTTRPGVGLARKSLRGFGLALKL